MVAWVRKPIATLRPNNKQKRYILGITIESGRLVVELRLRRRYTWPSCSPSAIPGFGALGKSRNGSTARPSAASSSDETREIWLVSLDPASGHEQKGRRPMLIVSPEAFNRITKLPVVLPITSGGNFARTAGFAVPLTAAGTKTTELSGATSPALSIWPRATAGNWKLFQTRSWTKCWPGQRRYLSEVRL